jgi:hypothetical protein
VLKRDINLPERREENFDTKSIGCSFKFILKVGVEESIVNAPLVSQQKNTNNGKIEVRFKQLIRGVFTLDSSTPTLFKLRNIA